MVMTCCSMCQKKINNNEQYLYGGKGYCEDCMMDQRVSRTRKTHWQYIRSIKSEYLCPAPGKKRNQNDDADV